MKIKGLIVSSVFFLILSVVFALYWKHIYKGGPGEQKGDYIFYCLKCTNVLAVFYVVLVRLLIRKMFPLVYLFITPFVTCFVSVFLAIVISVITERTKDMQMLQLYLFIHGFFAIFFVSLLVHLTSKFKKKHNSTLSH
jgi:hypothetical protein